MPKITTTTEVTQTTEVKLSATVQTKVLARLEEYARLSDEITKRQARQDDIKSELDTLFADAGEFDALLRGVDIHGFKVKMISGTKATLDKMRLMRTHGLTQADLDAATDIKPTAPYVKITAPRKDAK